MDEAVGLADVERLEAEHERRMAHEIDGLAADEGDFDRLMSADTLTPEQMQAKLDELLAGVEDAGVSRTDDERLVNRYLRRRGAMEAEIARLKECTAKAMASLQSEISTLDHFCRRPVEDATRRLLEGSKKKSVNTPFGTAGFRTNGGRPTIMDPIRAVAAAKASENLRSKVVVTETLPYAVAVDHFKATGELLPGVEITPKVESFYTK